VYPPTPTLSLHLLPLVLFVPNLESTRLTKRNTGMSTLYYFVAPASRILDTVAVALRPYLREASPVLPDTQMAVTTPSLPLHGSAPEDTPDPAMISAVPAANGAAGPMADGSAAASEADAASEERPFEALNGHEWVVAEAGGHGLSRPASAASVDMCAATQGEGGGWIRGGDDAKAAVTAEVGPLDGGSASASGEQPLPRVAAGRAAMMRAQRQQAESAPFLGVDEGEPMVAGPLESEDRPTIDVSSSMATASDGEGHTAISTPAPMRSFPFELLVVSEVNKALMYSMPAEVSHVRLEAEGGINTSHLFDKEALAPLEHESMQLRDERQEHTLRDCLKVRAVRPA
jgi:hypothetical protein